MKKDGKYRFNLQFSMKSEEQIEAGELLERLGNQKSSVVVAALHEYLSKHPELLSPKCKVQIQFSGAKQEQLESIVRRVVEERLSEMQIPPKEESDRVIQPEQISTDIMDMLSDLDMFQM